MKYGSAGLGLACFGLGHGLDTLWSCLGLSFGGPDHNASF